MRSLQSKPTSLSVSFVVVIAVVVAVIVLPATTWCAPQLPKAVPATVVKSFVGHGADVYAVRFDAKGARLATASFDRTVRIWNVADGKPVATLKGHEGKVLCVAFAPGGQILSGSEDKTVRLWEVPEGGDAKEIRKFSGHGGYVQWIEPAPNGKTIASCGKDKTVRIWNLEDGKQLRSITAHGSSVYTLAFNSNGTLLASGGLDRVVKLWNPADGKEIKKLEGHEEGVFCLQFSSDGQYLYSGSSDLTLRKWSVADGKEVAKFAGHPGWVCSVAVLPGEGLLSVDYGGHIIQWDARTAQPLAHRRVAARNGSTVVYALGVSPDGRWAATAHMAKEASLFEAMERLRAF